MDVKLVKENVIGVSLQPANVTARAPAKFLLADMGTAQRILNGKNGTERVKTNAELVDSLQGALKEHWTKRDSTVARLSKTETAIAAAREGGKKITSQGQLAAIDSITGELATLSAKRDSLNAALSSTDSTVGETSKKIIEIDPNAMPYRWNPAEHQKSYTEEIVGGLVIVLIAAYAAVKGFGRKRST